MYTIYSGNNIIHYPLLAKDGLVCVSPVLTTKVNSAGQLRFTVLVNHPFYDGILRRKTYVAVYNDGLEEWRGRVISTERGWNNSKVVTCEGELAYLLDTMMQPFVFKGSPEQLLTNLINNHNTRVGSGDTRRFALGDVTVTDDVEVETTSALSTWDIIKKYLINNTGYIYTRKADDVVYIDYVEDFATQSSQKIMFGKNMLDFSDNIDAAGSITSLYAYGAQKNKLKLYKRRSSSSYKFDLITNDIVEDDYLIVANGAAMKNAITSGKIQSDLVTDENGTITIRNLQTDLIWSISPSTVKDGENVTISGSITETVDVGGNDVTRTITFGGGPNDNVVIGGGLSGQSSGSFSASIDVDGDTTGSGSIGLQSQNSDTSNWRIKNGSNFVASTGEENKIALVTAESKKTIWSINNSENGASFTNSFNSENDIGAALNGDVDSGFFYSGSKGSIKPESGNWDGNRVTAKRVNNGSVIVTLSSATSFWGQSIYGTKVFNEAETPAQVLSCATEYLAKQFAEKITIKTTAVDLSVVDGNAEEIKTGTYVEVVSILHDVDITLLCNEKTVYLTEPDKTVVVLGAGEKTLSDLQGGFIADVRRT